MTMKKYVLDFLRRGAFSAWIGPVVLAALYFVSHYTGAVEELSAEQVCLGIFSLTALAFVAGGINFIYQIERLPLMLAILIHGAVLYLGYLVTYLVNDWLEWGALPIIVFTAIFVIGYLVIWFVIYQIIKRGTTDINKKLEQNRKTRENK